MIDGALFSRPGFIQTYKSAMKEELLKAFNVNQTENSGDLQEKRRSSRRKYLY